MKGAGGGSGVRGREGGAGTDAAVAPRLSPPPLWSPLVVPHHTMPLRAQLAFGEARRSRSRKARGSKSRSAMRLRKRAQAPPRPRQRHARGRRFGGADGGFWGWTNLAQCRSADAAGLFFAQGEAWRSVPASSGRQSARAEC